MERNQYNLKQILKESGCSQSLLAQKLGISRQHLHDIVKLNRKSKYSTQIFDLLKQEQKSNPALYQDELVTNEMSKIESLPMILADDLIRIYQGSASINLLNKPFYAKYPFVNFAEEQNHFCLRLADLFDANTAYVAIGAFRLCLSLEAKKGQIVLLYLSGSQKMMVGKININPETNEKFILNNNSMHMIQFHDSLIAECTQIMHVLV